MVFDGITKIKKDDGTIVIAGDLGEAFGAENILFRNVRSLSEAEEKSRFASSIKNITSE